MNQPVQPKKPPTMLQVKREEMLSHLDSHVHLSKAHGEGYGRPVILEAPIRSPTISGPQVINNDMTSVAAAILDGKSILITDMTTMNGVDANNVNIFYLVHPGPKQDEVSSYNGQYPKIFIHVNSIKEALDAIKAELRAVSDLADIKNPMGLDARCWSFMATREIRIIGTFKLLAEGLEFANLMQVGWPNITKAGLFKTSSVGKGSFTKNNFAKALAAYRDNSAAIEANTIPDFNDPYWIWAWYNVKATVPNYRLDVRFTQHTKNKNGDHQPNPTSGTDLIIITAEHYAKLTDGEGVGDAMVIVVDDKAPMLLGTTISFFADFHHAVEYVLAAMRVTEPMLAKHAVVSRLKEIKHIHLFADVIGEAY